VTDTSAGPRTLAALGAAVLAELKPAYTLVYLDQGEKLPDDVVKALVQGDNPWETEGGERLTASKGDEAHAAARKAVDELAKDITERWEREDGADYSDLRDGWVFSDEQNEAIYTVQGRDDSNWAEELIAGHGKVLLRVLIAGMDEDADHGYQPMSREKLLDLLGFEHTEQNLEVADEVVSNASPEYNVAMGYALLAVDLADIDALPVDPDVKVELRDPHVWLGSPFAGSGWCSEDPFTGTLTVTRGDLRTDADAFGYSWEQVVGGLTPGDFGGSLALATPTPEPLPLGTVVSSRAVKDVDAAVRELARARGWQPGETEAGDAGAALAWLDRPRFVGAGYTIVRDDDGVHVRQALDNE